MIKKNIKTRAKALKKFDASDNEEELIETNFIDDELSYLEPFLKDSENEWEWKIVELITKIPPGKLITYGKLLNPSLV